MKAAKPATGNIVRAILILALIAGSAPSMAAQTAKPKAASATAPAKSQTAARPAGGPQEGIKVHGHWVIEVRNPDGTLAARREFDNALTAFGAATLAKVLARLNSLGPWSVLLDGNPPPCRVSGNPNAFFCDVFEPAVNPSNPGNGATFFPTLTVTLPVTGANAGKLVLSGQLTAGGDGNISRVSTLALVCAPSVALSTSCNANTAVAGHATNEILTDHFLPTPIQVVAGQIIQFTVVISFS